MSKKDEMLQAALQLFAAEGYENVGIQKIVTAVGVQKPTLYHYFGSKQGLLQALLEAQFEPFLHALTQVSAYSGDLTRTLEAVMRHYFHFARTAPEIYRFVLSLVFSSDQSEARQTVLPFLQRQTEALEALFAQAERDHGNMRGRSQRYAMTFLGTINAWISASFYGRGGLSHEEAHLACKQYMHGIFS